ncbi:MAG: 16S rRNA (adenine(1518)-N(6)/adenine(1519)-N(6))-dimethyltransferase RsmA [Acidiferrobacter sp.]
MPSLKKRFGQHFLHDEGVLRRIASACIAAPGDLTVEIGPGAGALTVHLLQRLETLHVIEIDRDLVAGLARRFPAERVTVYEADALRFAMCARIPGALRVVGNLPYNISSPLIFHLLSQPCIQSMVFLLQKEVVDRLAASPGGHDYGRLSVMVQAQCEVTPLLTVAPDAFTPPPKVESRLVYLRPIPKRVAPEHAARFAEIVATAFSQRRKMLRHNLKRYFGDRDWKAVGIDPTRRAETLAIEEFAMLAAYRATTPRQG